jgi:anti-sigma factor RsiW
MAAICVQVRARLEALVDGELDAGQAAALRAHLAECASCRAHHAEASSLPNRLAAIVGPDAPPALVDSVLRRVRGERIGPWHLWGPLFVEAGLALIALWYLSGWRGLAALVQRTASDVGALIGWGVGQADPPVPVAGDVFLLLLCGLLMVTTLYHLALLARQGQRLS